MIRLAQLPSVKVTLVVDNIGVATNDYGFSAHRFVAFSLASPEGKPRRLTKQERIREIFRRTLGGDWRVKKQADFLSQFVSESSFQSGIAGPNLLGNATSNLFDATQSREAAKIVLKEKIPGILLPSRMTFDLVTFGDEFVVDTNLDFGFLAQEYGKIFPPEHSTLNVALVLSELIQSSASFGISANLEGDIITNNLTSALMRRRLKQELLSSDRSLQSIDLFYEWILSGKSLAEALNSKSRTFDEFLDLLEKASEFKKWLVQVEFDESLVKEYIKEVSSIGWVDKLHNKVFRYLAFGAAGAAIGLVAPPVAGVAAGAALAAVDTFIVDRIKRGWRPNHFVNGPLKTFL